MYIPTFVEGASIHMYVKIVKHILYHRFTVVQSYSVYWAKQSSAIIQEGICCVHVCTCWLMCSFLMAAFTLATDPYLIFANQFFIGTLQANGSDLHAVLSDLENAGGLDYHYRFVAQ